MPIKTKWNAPWKIGGWASIGEGLLLERIWYLQYLHHTHPKYLPLLQRPAVFFTKRLSINTLSDNTTLYSKCATLYTIGLWRKLKSCDKKHDCLLKICSPPKGRFFLFSGLQLHGVALRDTVHLYSVTSYFLLYPLLYGAVLSDSVIDKWALHFFLLHQSTIVYWFRHKPLTTWLISNYDLRKT